MKPDRDDGLSLPGTLPTGPLDPTRTAHSTGAPVTTPVAQPTTAALFRAPERYEILHEHGRGGLGKVSRAHDRELGRDVAIKELISRTTISEVRFLREAMITARLEHPGIVPMYEAGRWPDGTPYYAMKLVSGRPLRDLIAERTTVDQRIGLLHHVIAVADAIAYAHGRNIIHRDLKPANVIVGDFGETIVIDWGLAKDLSTSTEEPTAVSSASSGTGVPSGNDLTTTGAVLGTPTYMAPEQERGERVDQRADVFAIGAMLWELCSLQKVPPANVRLRHRLLRKAGIDQDLAIIIDKALDPDPQRRYPDAGTLAADLKAFKSGARIAARSYSLLAVLVRWTRRHRQQAATIVIGLLFALGGIGAYIRNIAAERDRADASQRAATTSLADLTLKHAELLLTSDPSAALDAISSYRGGRVDVARQVRAEALARGVAVVRSAPHTDAILWTQGIAGGWIVTLSRDGTISRTASDGSSVIMARNVKRGAELSYAPSLHLLAYVCDPEDLCLLEITSGRSLHVPSKNRDDMVLALSFSPDESKLAVLSPTADLRVLDIDFPQQPTERFKVHVPDGHGILFADRDAIAVGTPDGMMLVHTAGEIQRLVDPDGSLWDTSPPDHHLVLATAKGDVLLANTSNLHITTRATLCHGAVSGVKALPSKHAIAFACKEGTVGVWTPEDGAIAPKAHLEGHANLLEVSLSGDYLLAAGDSGVLTVIDLQTNITCALKGQGFRLTAISAPTPDYPFLLSADVRGGVRAWPSSKRAVRVAADLRAQVYSGIVYEQEGLLIAATRDNQLLQYSAARGLQPAGAHTTDTPFIESSPRGNRFATYGSSDVVEVWSLSPLARTRVLHTPHKSISHLAFIGDTDDLITSGRDADLIRWSSDGVAQLIHRFTQPIESFLYMRLSESIVAATTDGALWLIGRDGRSTRLRLSGTKMTTMLALPDGSSVCVGFADGDSIIIDTISGRQRPLRRAAEGIRDIATTRDGNIIALAANDGTVHVGVRNSNTWQLTTWTTWHVHVRKIAFTHGGTLLVLGTDGLLWFYSTRDRTWQCTMTGTTELVQIVMDSADKMAYIFDADGHLLSVDLAAIRAHSSSEGNLDSGIQI